MTSRTEPTCGTNGSVTYTCSCGDSYTETLPATGQHTWDGGVVTQEPQPGVPGVMTYTCTVCRATYTKELPALEVTPSPSPAPPPEGGDGAAPANPPEG